MNANLYMHRYGAPREMLGADSGQRPGECGAQPAAIYRDPMTMDDYLAARPITSPFGLYDCDVPCDASIAVVVSDASVADDLPNPAVRIEAVGTQIIERISWDQGTLTHEPQVLGQAAHLWTRTSLRPSDVDLALVYDGFTFNAISWLEGLGFCGIGEAQDWLDQGRRIALDGELPVNPHGGQLSEGRTHGFGFIYEAVMQLRHGAGERQVAGATTAVVTTGGGTPSGVLLLQGGANDFEIIAFAGFEEPASEAVVADKPNGPRSKKGALTRARLVDAAKEIFEEDGFLDARISDIAERAGLSHGSFYHYFESKEQVFLEVAVAVDQLLSEPLTSVIRLLFVSSSSQTHPRRDPATLESYRDESRIMGVIEQVSRYDEQVKAVRYGRHLRYTDLIADSIRQLQRPGAPTGNSTLRSLLPGSEP